MNVNEIQKKDYFLTKFVVVFLFFLQSYYFYQFGIAPFPIIGVLLLIVLFILYQNWHIPSSFLKYFIIVLMLMVLSVFGTFLLNNDSVMLPTLLFTQVGFFLVALTVVLIGSTFRRNDLDRICYFLLILQVFFFYIQFFSYHLVHLRLDFLAPVTGEIQRNFNGRGLFRGSGLFNEPATYSQCISMLILLSLNQIISKNKIAVFLIALASIYLSLSLLGFFEATAILILYLIRLKIKIPLWCYTLVSILFIFGLSYIFYNYASDIALIFSVSQKFSSSGGLDGRAASLMNYSSWVFSAESLLFGPILLTGVNVLTPIGSSFALLIASFGLIGGCFYFFYILKQIQKLEDYLLFFILIVNAPLIQYPISAVVLASILFKAKKKSNNLLNINGPIINEKIGLETK